MTQKQKHSSIQDTANATRIIISELYNKGNIKTYILTDLRVAKDIQSRRARKTWSYLFTALDDDLFKSKVRKEYAVKAIFSALKLYAFCQQSRPQLTSASSFGEKHEGKSLFEAFGTFSDGSDYEKTITKRVNEILIQDDFNIMYHDMTHLLILCKSYGLNSKIDFPRLAADFYVYQQSQDGSGTVCLRWGEQFYHLNNKDDQSEQENN